MKKKLFVGLTLSNSVSLLVGQLKFFSDQGYDTFLLCPDGGMVEEFCQKEGCKHIPIKIEREITLSHDIKTLFDLIRIFRREKPDIINLGTPKISFLGLMAGKLCGIKKRVYTCRGFRYEREHGIKRLIVKNTERISGLCAHKIICISPSLKELAIKDHIFRKDKCVVINKGSSNGFDLDYFNRSNVSIEEVAILKEKYSLNNKFVFGFLSRINDHKGINELVAAFEKMYEIHKDTVLLIVGPLYENEIADRTTIEKMQNHPGIILTGKTANVPLFLTLMDVFVVPTWAEGFGNVFVQAAAMGIPVISTNVTGVKDSVSNGYNGILVDVKSPEKLNEAMTCLYDDKNKRQELGNNGLEWAKNFTNTVIWEGMNDIFNE